MASKENEAVHKLNGELLVAWTSDPDATVDDFRQGYEDFLAMLEVSPDATFEDVDAGGVPSIWCDAPGADASRAVLHFHSGGYVIGSAGGYKSFGANLSAATGARVLLVDYRRAPEEPYPAALDDGYAAYKWVLDQGIAPGNVALCGDSAGGGLCLALLQRLRDQGDPAPSCGVAISPWTDFALTGDSVKGNEEADPLVKGALLEMLAPMYAGETDVKDPGISPLYGNWAGLPPILAFAGSIETLRDDAKRCVEAAQAAGGEAEFVEGEDMVHIWTMFADRLPEARETLERVGSFVKAKAGATV